MRCTTGARSTSASEVFEMLHRTKKRFVLCLALGIGAIATTLALWPRETRADGPVPVPVERVACAVADVAIPLGGLAAVAPCPPGGGGPPPPGLPPGPGCAELGAECGEVADGRGGVLDCGEC